MYEKRQLRRSLATAAGGIERCGRGGVVGEVRQGLGVVGHEQLAISTQISSQTGDRVCVLLLDCII